MLYDIANWETQLNILIQECYFAHSDFKNISRSDAEWIDKMP